MIKKITLSIFLILGSGYAGLAIAKHFWRGETLTKTNVEKRWGKTKFEIEKFKTGDLTLRASMAASLMDHSKIFIGKDPSDVRKMLGDFDGFYFTDMFPTYLIQRAQNRSEEAWQIVFLLGRDKKVSEVIVHKNCCD